MKSLLRSVQIISILAFGTAFDAYADSWNCSHSDLVREVHIEYPEGGSVPCNVVYKKHTEGVEDQVLWSALSEEGYCEEKARELVVKLESSGWVCLETVSAEVIADGEADQAADTGSEEAADTGSEEAADTGSEEAADTGSGAAADTE